MLVHAAPLQAIVVVGAVLSASATTALSRLSCALAGAPPACPAIAIQSRKLLRSESSTWPLAALHDV